MAQSDEVTDQQLMLFDAAGLYFRAFYGVKGSHLSPGGLLVNAVRGFLEMFTYVLDNYGPAVPVACWDDDWRPQWRVDAIKTYKAHRVRDDGSEDVPDALSLQVPVIAEALSILGVPRVGAPGCEADDVIGTLATRWASAGGRVLVVSGDRDLLQLVDDSDAIEVLYIGRGVRNAVRFDQRQLHEKYGVWSGDQYVELAVMRGDSSDGLPGVRGVGDKTAVSLIEKFGTLDGILAAVDDPASDMTPAQRTKFRDAREYLTAASRVVSLVRDAPLDEFNNRVIARSVGNVDDNALSQWVEEYGLAGSMQRASEAIRRSAEQLHVT